ncbi:MAG: (E)-4-hydroxy-3-methylbut-2-enyl-diphosphate synthase [Opitutae bacterium]
MGPATPYCVSRFHPSRRSTREVNIGQVILGGQQPVRVQSMTTTDTLDIQSTVRQTIELAEAGCEIVRITAPNIRAAKALKEISSHVRAAKIEVPLVADIHFMPQAAMEAAKHVEKVRVNPGNYADRKKFQTREYSDVQYEEELERLHHAFSPLVLRCKELGRAMRIGTNHGSLSDRIMNRFGDSPRGMAESALEFLRIARSHGYHDLVLSMKSSNPKVMIEAYRLVVSLMHSEGMDYPLHLGVTEAGDGEDARIKSAIGIGSLLLDGLGDTLRVSLTEDPVAEIPVARDLAHRAHQWWQTKQNMVEEPKEFIDPFVYQRRPCPSLTLALGKLDAGEKFPPVVLASASQPLSKIEEIIQDTARVQTAGKDAPLEGLIVPVEKDGDLLNLEILRKSLLGAIPLIVIDDFREDPSAHLADAHRSSPELLWHAARFNGQEPDLARFLAHCESAGHRPCIPLPGTKISAGVELLLNGASVKPVITLAQTSPWNNPVAGYRALTACMKEAGLSFPIWIRNTSSNRLFPQDDLFSGKVLDSSILSGSLLCDGMGDLLSIEHMGGLDRNRALAYNILQGARARISKTEFIACPSCGRTLFDLQSTTKLVKQATGHLKGVTIAVMGCIVNGPGEMADADFGYVGSGPGKIDLYVGKNRVKSAIPQKEAVDRLIDLIQEEGKWIDP